MNDAFRIEQKRSFSKRKRAPHIRYYIFCKTAHKEQKNPGLLGIDVLHKIETLTHPASKFPPHYRLGSLGYQKKLSGWVGEGWYHHVAAKSEGQQEEYRVLSGVKKILGHGKDFFDALRFRAYSKKKISRGLGFFRIFLLRIRKQI
ncbi:MAG: hypothetical protein KA537_03395, partial [Candidatus Moranbacteria bacterium]|nr:hypothetical protein [Candidatus Moranbacteria bacterium]